MCSQVETSFSQSSQQSSGTALEIIISQSYLDRGGIRRAYPKGQGGSYLAKGNFMEKGNLFIVVSQPSHPLGGG